MSGSSSRTSVTAGTPPKDLSNPRNWSKAKKWYIAFIVWNFIAPIDMSSTFYAGGQTQIERDLGASTAVAALGVGVLNLGFAIGPLIAAPLSEVYGRQPVYVATAITFAAFSLGASVAQNVAGLIVCRFFAGLFGAPVFSNFGGTLADLFTPEERGPFVAIFTLVLQGAPTIGPVPSMYMGQNVSWRWLLGLLAIWGAAIGIPVLLLPETEPNAIERRKAKKAASSAEKASEPPKKNVSTRKMLDPIVMLFGEPILLATCLYHAFVYGLLFLLLEAWPFVYSNTYGFTPGKSGLVFLAPWIGNVLGIVIYFGVLKPRDARLRARALEAGVFTTLAPEYRLPGVVISSLFVPIGMFWFAGTARASVPSIVPILSGVPVGMGMTLLQSALANYYIDLYPKLSASALAGNVFARNIAGTFFPTFAVPMYQKLGAQNATLVLACISLIGIPAGIMLMVLGKPIRKRSRRALQDDVAEETKENIPDNSNAGGDITMPTNKKATEE